MDGVVLRTFLGLSILIGLACTAALWPWGVCTLLWVVYTVFYGTTYVVEPVERAAYPRLFWFVTSFWTISGLGLLATEFYK